ncbi:MAG: hypothetical protein ACD_21C00156G0018 [uncultured bacterium]|nr:MAG: hypothetical protein ACD_21C00156G0018 [uncultured bacterium]
MLQTFTRICLILTSAFLLTSCGFTLRTAKSMPPQLHKIYYQADNPYGQFEVTLKKVLKSSNVALLTNTNNIAPILHVTSNYNTPSTTSSISSAEARTYTLTYSATISINCASGKPLLAPQTVSVSRSIILQPNEILEISPQTETAKREMCQELSTKVLNILCAPKTFQALSQS